MSDYRDLVKVGWWVKHGDSAMDHMFSYRGRVPASETAILQRSFAQVTADTEQSMGYAPWAALVQEVKYQCDGAEVHGQYHVLNKGTVGTLNSTLASNTAAGTMTGYRPLAITLASTVTVPSGAGLTWKRGTTGGNGTLMAGEVQVLLARDITQQDARLGPATGNITITRVAFVPDTTYTAGAISLINAGTAGTATDGVGTLNAAALTGGVAYDLTLGTGSALNFSEGQVLTLRRATASGDKTLPAGMVIVEAQPTN